MKNTLISLVIMAICFCGGMYIQHKREKPIVQDRVVNIVDSTRVDSLQQTIIKLEGQINILKHSQPSDEVRYITVTKKDTVNIFRTRTIIDTILVYPAGFNQENKTFDFEFTFNSLKKITPQVNPQLIPQDTVQVTVQVNSDVYLYKEKTSGFPEDRYIKNDLTCNIRKLILRKHLAEDEKRVKQKNIVAQIGYFGGSDGYSALIAGGFRKWNWQCLVSVNTNRELGIIIGKEF